MSHRNRNAIILAITGGIACGKSEVGQIMDDMGFLGCDADRIAHELMAKGSPLHERVVEQFGEEILGDDGRISRPKLGKIVFENPDARLRLNRLVHPAVGIALEHWITVRRAQGEDAVAQVPLLFESGLDELDWDAVICVSSEDAVMMERLQSRGMTRQEARKRIEAQMDVAEKERRADRVIRNSGSLQELEKATRKTVESLMVER